MEPFKKSDLFVLPVTEKHFTEMNLLGIKVTAAAVIYVTQLYIAATTIILLIYIYIYTVYAVANILFLESPAGVGFSHSNSSEEMSMCNDARAQVDNYVFLRHWFERFPEYRDRELYIAGESYAGHYIPQLAEFILHMNDRNKEVNIINIQGTIVCNIRIFCYLHMKLLYI